MADKIQCSHCLEWFEPKRSDEEAIQEYIANFGGDTVAESGNVDIICEDCYHEFMKWYKAVPDIKAN